MESEITRIYGNRVRVRACGVCWHNGRLLMVNHQMNKSDFWAPPGGGVDFGERTADTLIREFKEETNLDIEVGSFLFCCEFNAPPLHAIELFFEVRIVGGDLRTGSDPELQLINEVRFFEPSQIQSLSPERLHRIFQMVGDPREINALKGFYTL